MYEIRDQLTDDRFSLEEDLSLSDEINGNFETSSVIGDDNTIDTIQRSSIVPSHFYQLNYQMIEQNYPVPNAPSEVDISQHIEGF